MAFEPEYEPKPKFKIECPLKFNVPEIETECIRENCAWWMMHQKACAVNVNARIYSYVKNDHEKR